MRERHRRMATCHTLPRVAAFFSAIVVGVVPALSLSESDWPDSDIPAEVQKQIESLSDADPRVRMEAAKALLPHQKYAAVRIALAVAEADNDKNVRAAAVAALEYEDKKFEERFRIEGYKEPTEQEKKQFEQYRAKLAEELLQRLVEPGTCDRVRIADRLMGCAPCDPTDEARNQRDKLPGSNLPKIDTRPDTWKRLSKRFPPEDRVGRGLLALVLKVNVPEIKDAVPAIVQVRDHQDFPEFDFLLQPFSAPQEIDDATESVLHELLTCGNVHQRRMAPLLLWRRWWRPSSELQATLLHVACRDTDLHARRNAILAFRGCDNLEPETLDVLRDLLLHDKEETVRRAASRIVDPTLDSVGAALRNRCALAQVDAALCLGDALSIRDSRQSATYSNIDAADAKAIEEMNLLAKKLFQDPDPTFRGLVALGIVNTFPEDHAKYPDLKHSIPVVLKALEVETKDPLPRMAGETSQTRHGLIRLLGRTGPDAVLTIPLLLKIVAESPENPTGLVNQGNEAADRTAAVMAALMDIGRPAIPQLKKALASPNSAVRVTSAMALAYIDPSVKESLPVLLESIRGECWGACIAAFFRRADTGALANLGHRAVPALLEMVRAGQPENRTDGRDDPWYVVRAVLCSMENRKTIPLFLEALKDEHEDVRKLAVQALSQHGTSDKVLAAIKNTTKDSSAEVRAAAEEAIKHIEYLQNPK